MTNSQNLNYYKFGILLVNINFTKSWKIGEKFPSAKTTYYFGMLRELIFPKQNKSKNTVRGRKVNNELLLCFLNHVLRRGLKKNNTHLSKSWEEFIPKMTGSRQEVKCSYLCTQGWHSKLTGSQVLISQQWMRSDEMWKSLEVIPWSLSLI